MKRVTEDDQWPVEKGHVILLLGDPHELQNRISFKHRYWSVEDLEVLVENISTIYGGIDFSPVATEGKEVGDVIREVSRIIFCSEYKPMDIGKKLRELSTGGQGA